MRFVVTLPLLLLKNKTEPARVHPTASSATVIDIGLMDLSGLKILFVDDEPDARGLVKRLLEECGAQVMPAESAQQALDLAKRDKPDVVISDIGMPETDGYEFLRQFRMAGESYSKVPAIALTAFARSEDRTRALAPVSSAMSPSRSSPRNCWRQLPSLPAGLINRTIEAIDLLFAVEIFAA